MLRTGSDASRTVPVAGTLLTVVAIAALALAYWGNVTGRERYLQSRNFRLLSDVAEQTQTMLFDSEQIVRRSICDGFRAVDDSICKATAESTKPADSRLPLDKETADLWTRRINADLQSKRQSKDGTDNEQLGDRRMAPIELWRGEVTIHPLVGSVSDIAQQFKQYRSSVHGEGEKRAILEYLKSI